MIQSTPPSTLSRDPAPPTIREKILSLLDALVKDSRINQAFKPVILNMAKNFLAGVSDAEIVEGIEKIRDELLPWLLNEAPHENKDKQ